MPVFVKPSGTGSAGIATNRIYKIYHFSPKHLMFPPITPPATTDALASTSLSSEQKTPSETRNSDNAVSSSSRMAEAEVNPAFPTRKSASQLQLNWRKGQEPKNVEKLTQNPAAELNLHILKGYPPVVILAAEEMTAALQEAKNDVLQNWTPVKLRPDTSDLLSLKAWKETVRSFSMKREWNLRLDRTIKIMNGFKRANLKTGCNFAYLVDSKLVGALLLQPGGLPYVADVLTHPGSEKACSVLMEEAVNLPQPGNSGPKLALIADNKHASEVYEHMGFIRSADKRYGPRYYMTLDPTTSDKWHQDLNGKWRMKKFGDDMRDQYDEKEYLG